MPHAGRPAGRFTQHKRIDRLREVLESEPKGLTLEDISTLLRIHPRSARRYLRELETTTELESVATEPGAAHLWRIKPSERGRAVSLRRAQAYSILAARRALDVLKGSALWEEVDLAFSQVERVAETPFRASGRGEITSGNGLGERFFFAPPYPRNYGARGEDLDELFRAAADLLVVTYRPKGSADHPRPERVALHPYAIVIHHGSVYVIGVHPHEATGPEALRLEAMAEVTASDKAHFELPAGFDASRWVHGELGVAPPTRARCVVEFSARAAEEIRARRVHPQQRLATSSDGRVRLSLPLVGTPALASWILGWGDAALVVEPPELAREVGAALVRAASRYAPAR
jgi:predicted DNA-binding transcriptional regulator YafY